MAEAGAALADREVRAYRGNANALPPGVEATDSQYIAGLVQKRNDFIAANGGKDNLTAEQAGQAGEMQNQIDRARADRKMATEGDASKGIYSGRGAIDRANKDYKKEVAANADRETNAAVAKRDALRAESDADPDNDEKREAYLSAQAEVSRLEERNADMLENGVPERVGIVDPKTGVWYGADTLKAARDNGLAPRGYRSATREEMEADGASELTKQTGLVAMTDEEKAERAAKKEAAIKTFEEEGRERADAYRAANPVDEAAKERIRDNATQMANTFKSQWQRRNEREEYARNENTAAREDRYQTARDVANAQARGQVDTAAKNAEGVVGAASANANATVKAAKLDAQTKKDVAKLDAQTRKDAAELAAKIEGQRAEAKKAESQAEVKAKMREIDAGLLAEQEKLKATYRQNGTPAWYDDTQLGADRDAIWFAADETLGKINDMLGSKSYDDYMSDPGVGKKDKGAVEDLFEKAEAQTWGGKSDLDNAQHASLLKIALQKRKAATAQAGGPGQGGALSAPVIEMKKDGTASPAATGAATAAK